MHLPMVCSCGTQDGEVEKTLRAWYRQLDHNFTKDGTIELDGLVMDFQARYGGALTIVSDQWFGISYDEKYEGADDHLYVEADRISDGVLAIFKELHGKYGPTRFRD